MKKLFLNELIKSLFLIINGVILGFAFYYAILNKTIPKDKFLEANEALSILIFASITFLASF